MVSAEISLLQTDQRRTRTISSKVIFSSASRRAVCLTRALDEREELVSGSCAESELAMLEHRSMLSYSVLMEIELRLMLPEWVGSISSTRSRGYGVGERDKAGLGVTKSEADAS
jgi:hypothetical protein